MNENEGPKDDPSKEALSQRLAELEHRLRVFQAEQELYFHDRKRLDDAFTDLRSRETRFSEEVIEHAHKQAEFILSNERFRNRVAAGVIALNVGLTGVYIGDAADPFGLGWDAYDIETATAFEEGSPERQSNDTLFFDDCVSAVERAYPGEFEGRSFSQDTEPVENGVRLRHTLVYDLEAGPVTVLCDLIFTSQGVFTTILSRRDG